MTIKVIIFDLDDTLIHEGFDNPILCNETMSVLNYLKNKEYLLCVATLNENAVSICEHIGILNYFEYIYKKDTLSKSQHFYEIINYFNVSPCDIILYDDVYKHIEEANDIGIHGILVNWETGITLSLLQLSLESMLRQSQQAS